MQKAGREGPVRGEGETHASKIVRMAWDAGVLAHGLEAGEPVAKRRKIPTQVDTHLDSDREEEGLSRERARLERRFDCCKRKLRHRCSHDPRETPSTDRG